MLKYAKIENSQTKCCSVGLGEDIDFYKSIGMIELEVEQGYDSNWYLKGYAPKKPLNQLKEEKIVILKDNAYNLIISKYPLYKQLNIIRLGPAEDLAQMSKYIDDIRIKVDSIEKQINLSSTEEQLNKININFIKE